MTAEKILENWNKLMKIIEDNFSGTFKVFNGEQELDVVVEFDNLVCKVTFYLPQSVTKDFHAEYFYINEEDTKNKVSINYEDGILYTSKVRNSRPSDYILMRVSY